MRCIVSQSAQHGKWEGELVYARFDLWQVLSYKESCLSAGFVGLQIELPSSEKENTPFCSICAREPSNWHDVTAIFHQSRLVDVEVLTVNAQHRVYQVRIELL